MSSGAPASGSLGYVIVAGIVILIVLAAIGWHEARRLRTDLQDRLGQIDSRVTQLQGRLEDIAKAAVPPRRGPDPNRVYSVRTDGAPSVGPATAPIVIAEFSDFQ